MDNELIYFTVVEVSKLLHLTVNTIKRYINQGKLKASKLGNSNRISKLDLLNFMDSVKR